MKNVPSKRTDYHECQWIQYLYLIGLLQGALRPDAEAGGLRTASRSRGQTDAAGPQAASGNPAAVQGSKY